MRSNQLRLLLLSVMAVFAISAVASASASAAATCYQVAVPGTGNYASSKKCEERIASTPKEWVAIEKLENQVEPGVWCAKVKAGEPSTYKDNKCTEPEASTGKYIKVKVSLDEWEVCEKGGTEEWSEHKCNAGKGTGEWSWKVLAAGKSYKTVSNKVAGSAPEELTVLGKSIKCTGETDKGTITGGKPGTDLASPVTFTGCTTSLSGCLVHSTGQANGTIALAASGIPTKLEQRIVGEEEVLVDNFEEDPTSHEFVTLQFEPESGKTCTGFTETKVKGSVAAEVINLANGEILLRFPNPGIEKDTLEAFGLKALFTSEDELSLENGWALRGR